MTRIHRIAFAGFTLMSLLATGCVETGKAEQAPKSAEAIEKLSDAVVKLAGVVQEVRQDQRVQREERKQLVNRVDRLESVAEESKSGAKQPAKNIVEPTAPPTSSGPSVSNASPVHAVPPVNVPCQPPTVFFPTTILPYPCGSGRPVVIVPCGGVFYHQPAYIPPRVTTYSTTRRPW